MRSLSWLLLAALTACAAAPPASPPAPAPAAPETPVAAKESPPPAEVKAPSAEPQGPAPAASSKATTPPPPLPEGTVVLHIGDSMADALGGALNRELEKWGVKGYLEAKEATYIPQWAGFKMQLDSHLAQRKPDLVVVTLGGNETKMPDPTERVEAIKRLVKKIGDRPCIWIAAPLWPGLNHTGILDVIRDNCAPCRYVDTNAMIPDLERYDGVHPTIPERTRWAQFMIRWLLQNRDPNGKRPWDFKETTSPPPEGSEAWLEGH